MRSKNGRGVLMGVLLAVLVPSVVGAAMAVTGTLAGKVTKPDGSAAAGLVVHVYHAKEEKGKEKKSEDPTPAKKKDEKGKAIAEAKADKEGKYTLSIAPGEYVVEAKLAEVGVARERVTVEEGKTVVVDLKLKAEGKGSKKK